MLVDKLFSIRKLLENKKSKLLFQVHDSIIFDMHPDEEYLVEQILATLSSFKSTSFSLEYKFGKNYSALEEKNFYIYSK